MSAEGRKNHHTESLNISSRNDVPMEDIEANSNIQSQHAQLTQSRVISATPSQGEVDVQIAHLL